MFVNFPHFSKLKNIKLPAYCTYLPASSKKLPLYYSKKKLVFFIVRIRTVYLIGIKLSLSTKGSNSHKHKTSTRANSRKFNTRLLFVCFISLDSTLCLKATESDDLITFTRMRNKGLLCSDVIFIRVGV